VSTFESIVLGVVQGLTEFLPISSTAHLRIVPAFVGWDDPGAAYTAVTQLGTMAAVVLFFREDLWRIGTSWLGSLRTLRSDRRARLGLDARLGWYILFATIPIGIFGLAFKDQIETGARNLYLIGIAMIVVGFVLLAAEEVSKRDREIEDIEARDAVGVGLAQTLALVPGVSRSGSTIAAGLFLGLDRPAAARFSFLLSIPAVVLSGLFELLGIITGSEQQDVATSKLVISTLCAFVVGYAAIAWLLRFLVSHSTIVFVVYRVVVGSLVIVLVATGTIH
jgi:undecaprenyl-diphosphatase